MPVISCRTLATGGAALTSAGAVSAGVAVRRVRSAATRKPIPLTKSRTLIRNSVSRSRIGSAPSECQSHTLPGPSHLRALRYGAQEGPGLRKAPGYGRTAVLEIERRYHEHVE